MQEFIYLSLKQEEVLAKDARLLHFFLLLQEGWSVAKILQGYTITNLESTGFLIRLDKLKVIELLPRNRVRKILGGQLRFLKEGPIGKQLRSVAKSTFLESDFKTENEYLTFLSLRLTTTDVLKLKTQLLQLSKDLSIKSELRHAHNNTQELGLIIGLRPWSAPFMQALRKRNSLKR